MNNEQYESYRKILSEKDDNELQKIIEDLREKVSQHRNLLEHPNFYPDDVKNSDEYRVLTKFTDFLEIAKEEYTSRGKNLIPTEDESQTNDFNSRLDNIYRLIFRTGGHFLGFSEYVAEVVNNQVKIYFSDPKYIIENQQEEEICKGKFDRESLITYLRGMDLGNWLDEYDSSKFGLYIMDGLQWSLDIHFNDGSEPFKSSGSNAYPYNFFKLKELFDINK